MGSPGLGTSQSVGHQHQLDTVTPHTYSTQTLVLSRIITTDWNYQPELSSVAD